MELIEKHASFGGWQNVYRHYSQSLKCEMNVGVYLPPKAENEKLPVLYWLSGLTCNEQNFITKSGMQRYAAEHNIIVVDVYKRQICGNTTGPERIAAGRG